MGAATLYRDSDTFPDGTRYEMVATAVPASDDYPEGVYDDVEYTGLDDHVRAFYDEMDARRDR